MNCRTLIKKIGDYKNSFLQVSSVSLLSEILYTSSADIPDLGDPRKSPKDLQNIIAAVNRFAAKIVIPNNWNDFGKNHIFLKAQANSGIFSSKDEEREDI